MGSRTFDFGAGDSLVISAHVPTVSQITTASRVLPYYALVLELDTDIIAGLVSQIGPVPFEADQPVRVDPAEAEVTNAALRLLRLLDRPDALAVLGAQLSRELHYWLLRGRHGGAIRTLGMTDSHAQRVARAVAILRAYYAEPVRIERLAEAAGMSLSAFHLHFREATSLSPLQFQKQLRLIEARRRMLAHGEAISDAAYGVGYESVPQFTREYARMFGQPPAREIRHARTRLNATA
jgi:AraC-like DNA-binding protein